MDNIKTIIGGSVITLLVGGAAYTFNQQDVVDNFAADTGLTQEQAEQYVNNVSDDELASFEEIGADYVDESTGTLELANDIDCEYYEYEWETETLSCNEGKAQLRKIGNTEQLLGKAFIDLGSDTASEDNIHTVITYLDQLNAEYSLEISLAIFDNEILDEMRMTNSYNKALLQSALDSE